MTDMTPAARSAVLKALLDAIKEAYEKDRDVVDDRLRSLYEDDGVLSLEVRVPGVTVPVAQLTLTPTVPTVAVDQAARLEWVRQNYPTEVETVTVTTERVRPAFLKVLDGRLKVDDEGVTSDPSTGQRIDWVRQVPAGAPKTTMTFKTNGRKAIAEAHAAGLLDLPRLLALPGGEQ